MGVGSAARAEVSMQCICHRPCLGHLTLRLGALSSRVGGGGGGRSRGCRYECARSHRQIGRFLSFVLPRPRPLESLRCRKRALPASPVVGAQADLATSSRRHHRRLCFAPLLHALPVATAPARIRLESPPVDRACVSGDGSSSCSGSAAPLRAAVQCRCCSSWTDTARQVPSRARASDDRRILC